MNTTFGFKHEALAVCKNTHGHGHCADGVFINPDQNRWNPRTICVALSNCVPGYERIISAKQEQNSHKVCF